jgi:hypothetical protein
MAAHYRGMACSLPNIAIVSVYLLWSMGGNYIYDFFLMWK